MKKAIILLSILLFIVGCGKIQNKDENMTISVPTSAELVTTNVTDTTAEFIETSDYSLDDIILYDKGEDYPSIYIKTFSTPILDYDWTYLVLVGDVIRWYSDDSLHISNADIGVFEGRSIDDVYEAPSLEQLLTQQIYTVGNFKFAGVWKGTYPATYFAVRIKDLSDVIIDEAPLYYVNSDRTRLVPAHPDGSLMNDEAMIYDNNTIYFTATRSINPSTDSHFDSFVSGTTDLSILGFTEHYPNAALAPFDDKNYTTATASTTMTYTVKGLSKFDTIALGNIKADTIDVTFKDPLGAVVGTPVIDKIINSERDADGNLEKWYTTDISYSESVMEINSTVEITITGTDIELGTILLGMSVDAGFTKLNLQNSYIDYSVTETNQFGNVDYVERGKVAVYDGSVDIFITDYDRIDRLMLSLGSQLIILNGSDAKNTTPNSQSIFASTQKIGRLFNFKQRTKLNSKRMHQMANYTFTLKATI